MESEIHTVVHLELKVNYMKCNHRTRNLETHFMNMTMMHLILKIHIFNELYRDPGNNPVFFLSSV